jgi:hypothetical protein
VERPASWQRQAPQCCTPKKNPALRRDFPALTQFLSGLAILLALLALTLTVRILLLLAGLLAAALLLAGLLTRVLILLARILVLVRHSGSPFCVVGNTTARQLEPLQLVSEELRFRRDHSVMAA